MNLRAAIIHVIGDIIQSIGVVIAALIIFFFPEARIADPITTMIFTVICIFTTVPIFRECMSVLMEATPRQIDVLQCFEDVLNLDAIEEIHDFHVWAISQGKMALSAHIRSQNPEVALREATAILREKYEIYHTTIQVEKGHPGVQPGCCDNDHEDHNHELKVEESNHHDLHAHCHKLGHSH